MKKVTRFQREHLLSQQKKRTRKVKCAVIRFWRAKGKFKLMQGKLYYDGKEVKK